MRRLLIRCLLVALLPPAGALADETGALDRPDGHIVGKATLIELVADATLYGDRSDGALDIEYHHPDGRSAYWFEGCLYRGQWWATAEELCYFYPTTDWPGPHCFSAEVWSGQLYMVGSGDVLGDLVIQITERAAGNSEHLALDAEGGCDLVSMLQSADRPR